MSIFTLIYGSLALCVLLGTHRVGQLIADRLIKPPFRLSTATAQKTAFVFGVVLLAAILVPYLVPHHLFIALPIWGIYLLFAGLGGLRIYSAIQRVLRSVAGH